MSSLVVIGLEVGLSALSVTSLAVDRRAVVTLLGRSDGESVLGESRVTAEVDAGHDPVDGVTTLSVLELEDIGLALSGGQLDGDTTTVVVGLPGLGVATTARRKGMHVTDSIRNRPRVDGSVAHVVGDGDAAGARRGTVATNHVVAEGVGKSRGSGGQSGSEDGLEEHFDCCSGRKEIDSKR